MLWHTDDAILVQYNLLRRDAFDRAADRRFCARIGQGPRHPPLLEAARDAFADLDAYDALADGDNLADAIRERHERQLQLQVVDAERLDDEGFHVCSFCV